MDYSAQKVSVIMAVYNAEKYLIETLDCIVNQTLSEIEIICINDGSTDGSLQILNDYKNKDERFIIITQENSGAAIARNNGIKKARGKYLSILDADDLFEFDMLETAYNEAQKHNADLVIFDNDKFDSVNGHKIPKHQWGKKNIPGKNPFSADDVMENIFTFCYGVAWNMVINREYVINNKIWFQDVENHNDVYFTVMCKLKAKRMCYINRTLAHYRMNVSGSLSDNRIGKKTLFPFIDVLKAIHKEILEMPGYKRMFRSFVNFFSGMLLLNLNRLRGDNYFKAFEAIKNDWLLCFPDDAIREDNYDSYIDFIQCRSIIDNSATDHLFVMLDIKTKENKMLRSNRQWYFSDTRVKKGDKIIIYGAGEIGIDYYKQLCNSNDVTLVDKAYKLIAESGLPVSDPVVIQKSKYDWIIVAVQQSASIKQIKQLLAEYGVEKDKIICPFLW